MLTKINRKDCFFLKISFIIGTEILSVHLTKYVQDTYLENFNNILKGVREGLNK